ncbi:hypothetical protein GCM10010182_67710 [Actinomadura cremea]|nr:hypothetical protein GCM10010182_67710 [Actinomadura cremea]
MGFTSAVRDAMLDLIDEGGSLPAAYVSLHTADPGTDGSSEVTGGSYARQAATWAAASGGEKDSSAEVVFNIPSGTTITHVGLWSASTSGTFRGGGPLNEEQPYPTGGTFSMAAGDLTAALT